METSKLLAFVDTITWFFLALALLGVMLAQPPLAAYCQQIFGLLTAGYVSLRLGYTAKAGVENYNKIRNTCNTLLMGSEEGTISTTTAASETTTTTASDGCDNG